jgi:RNA polymerase sigma-70 factor, ECF subfamily
MPKLDEQQVRSLLLRTASRDPAAFEQLYRLTAPLLLGVSLRVVGRRELAEEILHDAFVRIWRSAHLFDPLAPSPMAWMVSVVRNRAIDSISTSEVQRTVTDRRNAWATTRPRHPKASSPAGARAMCAIA